MLHERRNQLAGTLSGGEQQMVAMGRALTAHPKLLLMDEPSMGLAPILVERSFEIIQQVHESGVAMLVVEQNANMALSIADRGYVLSTGPLVSGPAKVESHREVRANGVLLTTSHDGYLARFGVLHRRSLMIAHDGSRLDGEDTVSPSPGGRIKGNETDYALRFHLHPSVKASRLSDARGVMLVLPNRDVWTFEALDDKVELEDSVFLAGNDGPRRTAQIVIRQDARHAASVRWSFVRSTTSPSATAAKRNARREPELPL